MPRPKRCCGPFDAALLDLRLACEAGLDLLPALLRQAPGLPIVVITAYATVETAIEAMRRGAFDYLPRALTPDQLRLVFDRGAGGRRLQSQVEELAEEVRAAVPEADLQTAEPAMRQALDVACRKWRWWTPPQGQSASEGASPPLPGLRPGIKRSCVGCPSPAGNSNERCDSMYPSRSPLTPLSGGQAW